MQVSVGGQLQTVILALLLLTLGVAIWLWPIGIGGKMPVGGDVTQFSIGLMAFLHRSLSRGRLPLWNDLWGYGFPGLAESQMGVFYPPHALLYGLLSTERAYTASLVLHTFWGALGTFWTGRRFGISPAGSALAGFAWVTSGFFLIHLPHQWGYTAASWMPWAWGLAWALVTGNATRRAPFLLVLILTLQVLPGHFQLAFYTQVSLLLLAAWGVGERLSGHSASPRGSLLVMVAVGAVFPLAAAQVWPTFRLAGLADAQRDYEYLSGFAATPIHLVSYVAPDLFRRSPLWRPLAWDPFRTSPEEHLAYVGLVPLFLAVGAMRNGMRTEPAVRALAIVAVATVVFSLGPYVPGFQYLIMLPGFSFFRAPARWAAVTALLLSLLAGRGFDSWRTWPRPGRSLVRFVGLAVVALLVPLLGIEYALARPRGIGSPSASHNYERALHAFATKGRTPASMDDIRVHVGLARDGWGEMSIPGPSFVRSRLRIYWRELAPTVLLLVAMAAIATLAARPQYFAVGLLVLTAFDLLRLGTERPVDLAPMGPLEAQSKVLAALGREGNGLRIVAPGLRNLPMISGVAPVNAYRTLDLPAVVSVTDQAESLPGQRVPEDEIMRSLRACGAGARVFAPIETVVLSRSNLRLPNWDARETIDDPVLAGWLLDPAWVDLQGPWASTFTIWRSGTDASRAWLVPLTGDETENILDRWSGDPAEVSRLIAGARALQAKSATPERMEIEVDAGAPAIVVISQLADPQWQATWSGPTGRRPATIRPVFSGRHLGAWQGVAVPEPGRWVLRLEYVGRDVQQGLMVSTVAWLLWGAAFLRWGRERSSRQGEVQ